MLKFISAALLLFASVQAGPATRSAHPVTATVVQRDAAPSPTQPGIICNCNAYHQVISGDTCQNIVDANPGITLDQFYQYNPGVGSDCSSLWGGYYVCVGIDSSADCSSTTTTSTTPPPVSSPTDVGFPPSPTQSGIPNNCDAYYYSQSGDTCGAIVSNFGNFTLDQFYSWNPAVGSDCSTLFVNYYYCIGLGPPITTTSTPISTSSRGPVTTPPYSFSSYSARPSATYVTPTNTTVTSPPAQTQSGIASDCTLWYLVQPYDTCDTIRARYATSISVADLLSYNPALGSNCTNLLVYNYVCVAVAIQTSTRTMTAATSQYYPPWIYTSPPAYTYDITPSPVPTGVVSNCQGFYQAEANDTCDSVVAQYWGLTIDDLEEYNGASSNGTNCVLTSGMNYCIGTNSTGSADLPTVTTAPSPTQSGIISSCNTWYEARDGDSCDGIAGAFSLEEASFVEWNPAVGDNCTDIISGDYYCVAIEGGGGGVSSTSTWSGASTPAPALASTTSSVSRATSSVSPGTSSVAASTTTSKPPSSTSSSTPAPTQTGIISTCNAYATIVSGDTCTTVADANGITLAQFESWNSAINSDCSNLFLGYQYCVGVASSSKARRGFVQKAAEMLGTSGGRSMRKIKA